MENGEPTIQELIEENRNLKERLFEAEQTIEAIRGGEVDAFIVHEPTGEQIYTLKGADHGYRVLVESITEGALILSSDDSIYYCNRTLGEMLGLPIRAIISRKLDSYVGTEGRSQLMELIKESRSFGVAKSEFLMRRNDGTLLPVNVSLNSIRVEDFEGICAVITDLSEQKRAEEELRRHRTELELLVSERTSDLQQEITERKRAEEDVRGQREWLRVTLTSIGDAVIATDAEARITFINPVAAELTGWREEEARGKLIQEVFTIINEKTRKLADNVVRRVLRDDRIALLANHTSLVTRDGREIPIEDSAAPIRNQAGEMLGAVLVFHDVTSKRRAQEALLKAHDELELRVRERTTKLSTAVAKLESMNQELQEFAFVASHDLQEPLRKIQAFGNILITKHKDSLNPQGQDYMERITKAANRMSQLLRSLLDYSRTGTSQLNYKPVSLTEVARDAANDLEISINRAKGSVEISELPTVDADAGLLRQLFQNVIGNSIKYRKESEPPVVKIYGKVAGATCQVMIEDNGIGFDECYSHKIFKPFERLHGKNTPYRGTGMGLAICKKIVNRHSGEITVKSTPEQGTTFIVTLPIEQEKGA
ncbi:MAG: PAS domain S-box protein [Syntrophobacteraceae bacterium]